MSSQKKQQSINSWCNPNMESWTCNICCETNPKDFLQCNYCGNPIDQCLRPPLSLVSSSSSESASASAASASAASASSSSILPYSISQEDDSKMPSSASPQKAPAKPKTSLGKRSSHDEDDTSDEDTQWEEEEAEECEYEEVAVSDKGDVFTKFSAYNPICSTFAKMNGGSVPDDIQKQHANNNMPTYCTLSNSDLIKKRMENPPTSNTKCASPNPSDTPTNAMKLHALSLDATKYIALPDAIMCKRKCGRVAKTRPVVVGGPSGPRPGMFPVELCTDCAGESNEECLDDAASCGCGRKKTGVDMPMCRDCYMNMTCVKPRCTNKRWQVASSLCSTCAKGIECAKDGCTRKRWREDSIMCATCAKGIECAKDGCTRTRWRGDSKWCLTCALSIKCEGENCKRTRDIPTYKLCYECQGRPKCRRCTLNYAEGTGSYCEGCKPLCKMKGTKCDGTSLVGKKFCRACKPKKEKKYCTYQGCPNLSQGYKGQRCDRHKLKW